MNATIQAIQPYLERFRSSFLVAMFIPALTFVTASILLFGIIVPTDVLTRLQLLLGPLGDKIVGWTIIVFTLIIGFTLSNLNTYIYKLFEGYVLTNHIPFLRAIEIRRARQLIRKRDVINKEIQQLEQGLDVWNKGKVPHSSERERNLALTHIQNLMAERDTISAEYDQRYPPYEDLILPTRFGNILRASETYPRMRWGIDAVTMWPRLIYAISIAPKGDEFLTKVDISNDNCSFLLNSSLLSGLLSGLTLLASIYQALLAVPHNLLLT